MERITLDCFDFFTPQGYDKIYREGKKVLMNLLDIETPLKLAKLIEREFGSFVPPKIFDD
jgi:hypothetical protein